LLRLECDDGSVQDRHNTPFATNPFNHEAVCSDALFILPNFGHARGQVLAQPFAGNLIQQLFSPVVLALEFDFPEAHVDKQHRRQRGHRKHMLTDREACGRRCLWLAKKLGWNSSPVYHRLSVPKNGLSGGSATFTSRPTVTKRGVWDLGVCPCAESHHLTHTGSPQKS